MFDGYLTDHKLRNMGFAFLGQDVLISKHARIFHPERISIGNHVRIDDFCILSGIITLGNHVHFAAYVGIMGGNAEITIGDYSGIAYQTIVVGESDDYSGEYLTGATVPMDYRGVTGDRITIGKHVIIGAHSTVLPDITIRDGCSFGANSLITEDTEEWGIYAGAPCKRIRDRSRHLLIYERKLEEGI